jgi:nitrogen fixation-related uncharacterized protein
MMIDAKGEEGEGEKLTAAHDPLADETWDGAPLQTDQLALDDNVRLPWLEAGDGEDDEFENRNTGQLIVLLAMGLLALALIGGGIWWVLDRKQDEAVVADGSILPAPKEPYKQAPQDPGGKTFAGTGDTSFAVAKGQTRPAQLDESGAKAVTPAPTLTAGGTTKAAGEGAASAGAQPKSEPAPSGVGVQIAAYTSRASADAGWTRLSAQYEALSGLKHRVVEGRADIGTVYRLQVLAGDTAAAQGLCGRLKAAGLACQVKN